MSSNKQDDNYSTHIDTGGGANIEGDVKTNGGDFIGRDQITVNVQMDQPPPPAPLRTRIPQPKAQQLIGRETELNWICQRLLGEEEVVIAAVRGIGGVGKTELAIAAVRRLEAHFEERVMWIDCGTNDIISIQARMAAALGFLL
ncbi:MAG: NB-ARC domain-containing protein, partial [Nitrososphaera sp.]|nr:NB-ARC domain-containing protein [Nitrososphaera sp.]